MNLRHATMALFFGGILLCFSDAVYAVPGDDTDIRAAIPSGTTLSSSSATARHQATPLTSIAVPASHSALQRRPRATTWTQPGNTRRRCQPGVGQYSCVERCDPCWQFAVSLPVWIPGITAQAASGGVSVDGDRDPLDALEGDAASDIEFAFVGAFVARRGRWGGGVDFLGARIKASASFTIADAGVELGASGKLQAAIARARIDYLYTRALLPWKIQSCGCAEHRVYAGARVYDVGVKANALNVAGLALDVSDRWVDPIIGFDSEIPVARNWSVRIAGDVGGFGISDNWSYSLLGGVHWRFASRWGLTFAYQLLDIRRDFGTVNDSKKIDITLRGPTLAIHFFF